MRTISLTLLLILSPLALAKTVLPKGCQPLSVQGETVTFKIKKASLILINNTGKTDLWLTHPIQDPGASAGWTSKIEPGKWSALALSKDFVLGCIESRPGHEQEIACNEVISACLLKKTQFPADAQGEFWAVENTSLDKLKVNLGSRGFVSP